MFLECGVGASSNNRANGSPNAEEILRFICLGYVDEKTWDAKSPEAQSAMMKESLAFIEVLLEAGHSLQMDEQCRLADEAQEALRELVRTSSDAAEGAE
jgi:hypothetical protein